MAGVAAEVGGRERRPSSATAHEVLLYQGAVATTYFCASSGGETMSAAEALGTAVPYLDWAVKRPYDTLSPYHDWGRCCRCSLRRRQVPRARFPSTRLAHSDT